jgi:hypothetical protein
MLIGHVTHDSDGIDTGVRESAQRPFGLVGIPGPQCQTGAGSAQRRGDPKADTTIATGHHGDSAGEVERGH